MALDLPEDAREGLVAWREHVLGGREELRLLAPDALHVTLVFLGYLPEKSIGSLAALVADAADGAAVPRLTPAGLKALPPRRPRLFALDVGDEEGRASALQARIADLLEAKRLYTPERRPFWPHVTLARVKRGRTARAPVEPAPPPGEAFEAAEVVLYRSHLGPAGARYESLARVPLGGDRPSGAAQSRRA